MSNIQKKVSRLHFEKNRLKIYFHLECDPYSTFAQHLRVHKSRKFETGLSKNFI